MLKQVLILIQICNLFSTEEFRSLSFNKEKIFQITEVQREDFFIHYEAKALLEIHPNTDKKILKRLMKAFETYFIFFENPEASEDKQSAITVYPIGRFEYKLENYKFFEQSEITPKKVAKELLLVTENKILPIKLNNLKG